MMSSGNSSVSFLSPSNPLSPLLIFRETSQNKPFFMAAILLFSTRKKLRMRISDVVEIALVSTGFRSCRPPIRYKRALPGSPRTSISTAGRADKVGKKKQKLSNYSGNSIVKLAQNCSSLFRFSSHMWELMRETKLFELNAFLRGTSTKSASNWSSFLI